MIAAWAVAKWLQRLTVQEQTAVPSECVLDCRVLHADRARVLDQNWPSAIKRPLHCAGLQLPRPAGSSLQTAAR